MRLLVLAALFLLSACTTIRARAYGGLTYTELKGSAALDSSDGGVNLGANRIDIEREGGLSDGEVSPYLRFELGIPVGSVTVSGFTFSETGDATLDAGKQYGDLVGGSRVSSHLQFTNIKAAAHFDLFNFGVLRLSPGLGVDFFDLDLSVTEFGTSNTESVDNQVYVPMVFVQGEVDLGVVAATVDLGYMQASLEDARGTYIDLEALVRFNPLPHLEFFGGYRFIDLDARGRADSRRYEADVRLTGWMLGGGVTF